MLSENRCDLALGALAPDEYFIDSGDPKWSPERYFRFQTRKQALASPQGSLMNYSWRNLVSNGFRTAEHGRKKLVGARAALQTRIEWFGSSQMVAGTVFSVPEAQTSACISPGKFDELLLPQSCEQRFPDG